MDIIAYVIPDSKPLELVPAPVTRQLNKEVKGISLCLPLQIANQWGWWMLNPTGFTAIWNGDAHSDGLHLEFDEEPESNYAASHFGFGVLTILVPFVFSTPPGWNIWLRGPTNFPKPGITALEGIVEGDWHNATATMNWRLEPYRKVRFEKGDPLCQIHPVPRNLEGFSAEIKEMPDDRREDYIAWREHRRGTLDYVATTNKPKYELGYKANAEQTKLNLSPWTSG